MTDVAPETISILRVQLARVASTGLGGSGQRINPTNFKTPVVHATSPRGGVALRFL